MAYDRDAVKSAAKFICGIDKACRICISPVGVGPKDLISIYDFVTIDTPYYSDTITYMSIFQELALPSEPCLPEYLCVSCAMLASNSFTFHKLCEYSQLQWDSTIQSLTKMITESKSLTPKAMSAHMILGERENSMLINKFPVNSRNKVAVLSKAKFNMKRRSKYVKVEVRKSRSTKVGEAEEKIRKDEMEQKKNPLPCPYCYKEFSSESSLEGHKERLHYPRNIKCDLCSEMFSTEKLVQWHVDMHHVPATCLMCGLELPSRRKLYWHKGEHHYKSSCPQCNERFTSKMNFKRHIAQCGNTNKLNKFICDICGQVYSHKQSIKGHMIAEHGFASGLSCEWCNKKYHFLSALKSHQIKHTRERNFTCEMCGAKLVSKRALIYHTRLHTGEKPYPCEICGERFLNMSRKLAHKRKVHLGRDKECDVCQAKFFTTFDLKKHRQRHNNPRSKYYVGKSLNVKSEQGKKKINVIVSYHHN